MESHKDDLPPPAQTDSEPLMPMLEAVLRGLSPLLAAAGMVCLLAIKFADSQTAFVCLFAGNCLFSWAGFGLGIVFIRSWLGKAGIGISLINLAIIIWYSATHTLIDH